ncbi:c-type cytochrome [Hymenobacter lapidarius]|nr:c-type cytochrome [Hymenobacter lapidarius]
MKTPLSSISALLMLGSTMVLLASAGCTDSKGGQPSPCNVEAQPVTYAAVVSPIFDARCRACHSSQVANSMGGGNDFSTYEAIKRFPSNVLLNSIRHAPRARAMPPVGSKLSDCDIERIERWTATGFPEK